MRVLNESIFSNADMSGALASVPILLEQDMGYSIQLQWTGAATGSFMLEGSNDQGVLHGDGSVSGVTNWGIVQGTTYAITAPGTLAYNAPATLYRWVRVIYTPLTGGSANLNARINLKGF
jgi:hypothetical protein